MKRVYIIFCLVFLILSERPCLTSAAPLDSADLALRRSYASPFHWENIEGPPYWVAGPQPHYVYKARMHQVHLAPGEDMVVTLPPHEMLRVLHARHAFQTSDLEFWMSDGSGLYVQVTAQLSSDGHSLLLVPERSETMLIRIRRPHQQQKRLRVAVFVSRQESLPSVVPYRQELTFPHTPVIIRRTTEIVGRPFWLLTPGAPQTITVHGPARLNLETILSYPSTEAQTLQTYSIGLRLDDQPVHLLEFQTTSERKSRLFIDDRESVVAEQGEGYVAIADGEHRLVFTPTREVYVRLLQEDRDAYLFPQLNRPTATSESEAIASTVTSRVEHALQLGRDNHLRDSGVLATAQLQAVANAYPYAPALQRLTTLARDIQTFSRDLLPREKVSTPPQQYGWFLPRSLLAPEEARKDLAVAASHTRDIRRRLGNAPFLTLPTTATTALVYAVPPRSGPAHLRVLVENQTLSDPQHLTIQLDQQEPVQLFVVRGPELLAPAYAPSYLEAGLQAFVWQRQQSIPALSAATAQALWLPQPLIQVGIMELPLPADVKEVRVWQTGTETTPLQVALQYTGTKPYRPTEMEYLGMAGRMNDEQSILQSLVATIRQMNLPPSEEPQAERNLGNFWVPLTRFLSSQQKTFVSSIAPLPQSRSATIPSLTGAEQRSVMQKAQAMGMAGQWLAALESWSQLVYRATGEYRRHGLWGRIRALQALGESFLAEQQLRGLLLYGEDNAIRATAFAQLQQFYTATDDTDALLALIASQTLHSPDVANLRRLFDILITAGEYEFALMVGMTLPHADRPVPLLLRAAYRLDWWATLDLFIAQLPNDTDRHFWQAQRAIAHGEYRQAMEHLEHAGADGQPLTQALTTAQSIAIALDSRQPETRAEALFAWEQWRAQQPGPGFWNADDALVTDYQGAMRFYSSDRDLYVQFYAATPQQPVQLQVQGPARLKVEVRPLHPLGTAVPLDDWLQIRAPGQLYETPIMNNLPTFGLQIVEDSTVLPGRAVMAELTLGPGLHPLSLSAKQERVALRFYTEQAEIPLEILPQLTRQVRAALWQVGEVHREKENGEATETSFRFLNAENDSVQLIVPPLSWSLGFMPRPSLSDVALSPAVATRLALRLGAGDERLRLLLRAQPNIATALTPEERVLASTVSGTGEQYCTRWLDTNEPIAPALRTAVCVAEGQVERLLRSPLATEDETIRQRMLLFLKFATDNPTQRRHMHALGEALFAAHPQVPGLAALHAQLTRESTWELLPTVQTSAGLRTIPVAGWQPESPSLRTRRALLPPLALGEYAVAGQGQLGIALHNLAPTTLLVDLSVEDVEYLPPVPLTAFIQVDQQPEQQILLSRETPPTSLHLPIPNGDHSVQVWMARTVVNQFLRVRVREQRPGATTTAPLPPSAIVMASERSYYVATAQEPLRFTVAGPQWLRIDEWRDEMTYSRTQFVGEGWQTVTLAPPANQPEALFRVFQTTEAEASVTPMPRIVKPDSHPVPFPVLDFRTSARSSVVTLADRYRLGRQEDGTWSLMTKFVRQRNFDEDKSVDAVPKEQFLENRATHRFFHQSLGEAYSETHLLTRVREHGGPTLGIAERLRFSLNWQNRTPLILEMQGEGYAQWPGGGRPPSRGGFEWSGLLRWEISQVQRLTPLWDHRPSAALFARALSLRHSKQYRQGYVDQDIFTNYKADHRAGLTLAESLSYRPWLDSEWTTRFALTSNETMFLDAPDNFALTSTWKQLLHDTQADVGYSFRTFFADSDRKTTSFRHILLFDVLQDYWFSNTRLEVGLNLRHDILRSDTTFNFFFTWHLDHGRVYRDFRPGLVEFLNLRRWRAAERPTNRVTPRL